MKLKYSVTFEFDERQPVTSRGVLEASNEQPAARRALKEAKKALRPVNWASVVCLLERVPD